MAVTNLSDVRTFLVVVRTEGYVFREGGRNAKE